MRTLLALALLLIGCEADVEPIAVEDAFDLGANPMVDVLFVVDDSNSMADIQTGVGGAWAALSAGLGASDWQIGVTTTDFDDPTLRGSLRWVTADDYVLDPTDVTPDTLFRAGIEAGVEGSQTERGLQAGYAAVTAPRATHDNDGFIREGARLGIVIVSDEDDCSDEGALGMGESTDCQTRPDLLVPVEDYAQRFGDLKAGLGDVAVHAMVETGDLESGCGLPNPGTRYVRVAQRTGGRVFPPCGDFAATMTALGAELAGQRRAYPLSRTADVATIEVTVTGADGTQPLVEDVEGLTGWTYDADANALLLGSAVVLAADSVVSIAYTIPAS